MQEPFSVCWWIFMSGLLTLIEMRVPRKPQGWPTLYLSLQNNARMSYKIPFCIIRTYFAILGLSLGLV